MIVYYIAGKQVSRAEEIEQNRANVEALAEMERGNMAAGFRARFVLAYDTERGELVPREKWATEA